MEASTTESATRRSQFSVKLLLFATVNVAVLLSLYGLYRKSENTHTDGYLQYLTAVKVIDFMEKNNGAWPTSWESLRSQFNENDELLEKYKKRVYVDFSLDLEEFQSQGASTDSSTFKVIYARFTTGFYAQGDANQVIYRYLKGKKKDSKG